MLQMMSKEEKSRISITIDNSVLQMLEKESKKENRSRSNLIESILKEYFSKNK